MRFIVGLVLLIRLLDAADSASAAAGPTQGACPSGAFPLSIDQSMTTMFATSFRCPAHGSSEEGVSGEDPSQVGPGSVIEPYFNNTRQVIAETEIERAMRIALGEPNEGLRLEITAHSREVLPAGAAAFPLSGASKPAPLHPEAPILWRGYWQTPDGLSTPIWARVRALRPRPVIRLRADVPGGTTLSSSLVEQTSVLDSALRADPPAAVSEYEGKVLRRFAKAGSIISLSQVTDPPLVLRNSIVRVDVSSGGVHLRLKARAETDGQPGESIRLMIPGGHRQFLATIQRDGSAVLNVAAERSGRPAAAGGTSNAL